MIFLSGNLKLLRKRQGISQQALADKLLISRASLAKYEGAVNEPSLEVLLRISRYFKVTTDCLLTVNLSNHKEQINLEDLSAQGMIVPIQVNDRGENVIEVVPHNAQAGYMGGYSDPGFIESLEKMALPFHEMHGKCRAFPVDGDSMPPFGPGSFVVGRQLSSIDELKDGHRYIVVSRDEGIVFKRVYRNKSNPGQLRMVSDNKRHDPFEMSAYEIIELWEFVAGISLEGSGDNPYALDVMSRVEDLHEQVQKLADELSVGV